MIVKNQHWIKFLKDQLFYQKDETLFVYFEKMALKPGYFQVYSAEGKEPFFKSGTPEELAEHFKILMPDDPEMIFINYQIQINKQRTETK